MVVASGIGAVEEVHAGSEVGQRRDDDQVVVVPHHAKGDADPAHLADRGLEGAQEHTLVRVGCEDVPPLVAAAVDVVRGVCGFFARSTRHESTVRAPAAQEGYGAVQKRNELHLVEVWHRNCVPDPGIAL
jgi:hypothetical protein